MVIDEETDTSRSLKTTLSLACAQSQSLARLLERQKNIIARLQADNAKLCRQLAKLRTSKGLPTGDSSSTIEVQELFQINAQEQAKTAVLSDQPNDKQKLKSICDLHVHSPTVSRDLSETECCSDWRRCKVAQRDGTERPLSCQNDIDGTSIHEEFPRKRRRSLTEENTLLSCDLPAIQQIVVGEGVSLPVKEQILTEKKENNDETDRESTKYQDYSQNRFVQSLKRDNLQCLLSDPTSITPLLSKSQKTGGETLTFVSTPNSDPSLYRSPSGTPKNHNSLSEENPPRPGPNDPNTVIASRNKGTIRLPPFSNLNLRHFEIKRESEIGHDHAFAEANSKPTLKRCPSDCTKMHCCNKRFKSFVSPVRDTPQPMTISKDYDLLLEFLGPGSAEKIKSLTTTARNNLVHEARARKLAVMYENLHQKAAERGQSPPGFWEADMPSTQEENERWRKVKNKERQ